MQGLRMRVVPEPPPVPYHRILAAWKAASFAPAACRAELERIIEEHEIPPRLFEPSEITRGGRPATDELLFGWFGRKRNWIWEIDAPSGSKRFEIVPEFVPSVADLVRLAREVDSREAFVGAACDDGHDEHLIRLLASGLSAGAPYGRWPAWDHPGLYRREHASLVLRTPAAKLMTDPQSLGAGFTTNFGRYPEDPDPETARVLVTHTHNDHWDLCSTLSWSVDEEPAVVPRVPAPSLLAEDPRAELELVGQAALAPDWHTAFGIGDVRIEVLPFYGEQPTRDLPLPFPLRNWGNCYRFDTPDWSAVVLVDSGADAEGTTADPIRRSVSERGPIDIVLSCCHRFPEAINGGLPEYVLAVPFEYLPGYFRSAKSITSGPRGLAEICEAAKARWFLPYAHGFAGLGRDPSGSESEHSESRLCAAVARALSDRKVSTEVLAWSPGDRMIWKSGHPVIEALTEVSV